MKIFILVIIGVLITSFAFAGSSAEVISIDKDDNGNIRVWTQYKVDGVEVESLYPKIGGKFVYCSRYNAGNFLGMTDEQIKTRIIKDVETHTETLIRNTYLPIANDDIFEKHLKDVVGSTVATEDVKIDVDTDGDGIDDKEVTIYSNGSSSVVTP